MSGDSMDTIRRLYAALKKAEGKLAEFEQRGSEPVAIIGMAAKFGDSDSPEGFWRHLTSGRSHLADIPADRWNLDRFWDPEGRDPEKHYTKTGYFLDDVGHFDPAFFRMTPAEARQTDPQQRILLEMAWRLFEDAGYETSEIQNTKTGVFVGLSNSGYDFLCSDEASRGIGEYVVTGNAAAAAVGRLSYYFGLKGPALALDTACSSSLVAVDSALRHLRSGDCDMAVAGGVNLMLLPTGYIFLSKTKALAADGRCKTFDASADGYGRGEGCGLVLLKPLSKALAAGDRIHAVIHGAGVNQDGASNGLTAPNGLAQSDLIRTVLQSSGIAADQMSFVECHGTGTSLGDPVELGALGAVFGDRERPLYVGSVKSQIGHTEAAAGIAGLLRAVMSLQNRQFLGAPWQTQPTAAFLWDQSHLAAPTHAVPLEDGPLFAGVSSFGFGGTNAHVVLGSAPSGHVGRPALEPKPMHKTRLWVDSRRYMELVSPPNSNAGVTSAPMPSAPISEDILSELKKLFGRLTELPAEEIHPDRNIFEYGVDSIMVYHWIDAIKDRWGIAVEVSRIYQDLNKVSTLAEYLRDRTSSNASPASEIPAMQPAEVPLRLDEGAYRPMAPQPAASFGDDGRLKPLHRRIDAMAAGSKAKIQASRRVLANNRNVTGFNPIWKEATFQPVAAEARGAHVVDVDGNDYIDFSMGFGVHLFGHRAAFLEAAYREALAQGVALGPLSDLALTFAHELAAYLNVERVACFNSGSEAAMVALRLVRAVTGKPKVVMFAGSYHGMSDQVLFQQSQGGAAVPAMPGLPENLFENVYALPYGDPEGLEFIRKHADEIAAVLVEPVQSRRPDLQPFEYLKELRKLCTETGIGLIFDEIVTGFRVHPKGVAGLIGVQPDLMLLGKVIGGGFPIGIVAGSARFLDAVDGGFWSFGDDSAPTTRMTFASGTFCHHPMTMSAGLAVLAHLRENPDLQTELNRRTERLAAELNAWLSSEGVPISVVHFGSLFRFKLKGLHEVLFHHLFARGIYIWEGRNAFLSEAHTEADVRALVDAVKDSVREMRESGVLGGSEKMALEPEIRIPLSPSQFAIWISENLEPGEAKHQLSESFLLKGQVEPEIWEQVIREMVETYPILSQRLVVETGEPHWTERREALFFCRLGHPQALTFDQALTHLHAGRTSMRLDVDRPLFSVQLVALDTGNYLLSVHVHHAVCDGWSLEVLFVEMMDAYRRRLAAEPNSKARPPSYETMVQSQAGKTAEAESFWEGYLQGYAPLEHSDGGVTDVVGASLSGPAYANFSRYCASSGVSRYAILSTVAAMVASVWADVDDLCVGNVVAGRLDARFDRTVGNAVNMQLLRFVFDGSAIGQHWQQAHDDLHLMRDYQAFPFEQMKEQFEERTGKKGLLQLEVAYQNFGWKNTGKATEKLDFQVEYLPHLALDPRKFPIELRFNDGLDQLDLQLVFCPEVLSADEARWMSDLVMATLGRLSEIRQTDALTLRSGWKTQLNAKRASQKNHRHHHFKQSLLQFKHTSP